MFSVFPTALLLILSAVKEFSNPVSESGKAPSARSISGRMLPLDHLGDHKASPPHSGSGTEYYMEDIQHTQHAQDLKH